MVPVPSEDALRNRDWIEGNMRKVNAATNGKVAYVYLGYWIAQSPKMAYKINFKPLEARIKGQWVVM